MKRFVVDDRAFLLGLDYLYRETMKRHEAGELLRCAQRVAGALGATPADVPIEGYYTESPQLTEYFRLVRSLQTYDRSFEPKVAPLPEFRRLHSVTSAPLFGRPAEGDSLFPAGVDPLSAALRATPPERWTVEVLTAAARDIAARSDEFSLVGLACRAGDSVVIAALRESVVLYADMVLGAALDPEEPEYVWQVDAELARQAKRFVDAFNELFGEALPPPEPASAKIYWFAFTENEIGGRCVRIGRESSAPGARNYHWAVRRIGRFLDVHEFWSPELWTTERYRAEGRRLP